MSQAIERRIPSFKHFGGWYWASLVLATLVAFFAAEFVLLASGKSIIWKTDAMPQYLNWFICEGRLFRGVFASIFAGTFAGFPEYLFSAGYGSDVFSTYQFFDPFNFLSVFVPERFAEYAFAGCLVARTVLSAVTFSVYCRYRGDGAPETFVASLCYAFCGFALFWGIFRHPLFMNWTMLLPLVMSGVDRVFDGKSPLFYTLSMALLLFISVYESYMTIIMVVGYCVIKFAFAAEGRTARRFLRLFVVLALSTVVAIAAAGVSTFPSILAIVGQDRSSVSHPADAIQSFKWFLQLPGNLSEIGTTVDVNPLYENAVAFVSAIALIAGYGKIDAGERRPWLVGLVVVLVCACSPYLMHMVHGMSYVSDRPLIILGFCSSYIVCLVLPAVRSFDRRDWTRLVLGIGIYLVLTGACLLVLVRHEGASLNPGWVLAFGELLVLVAFAFGIARAGARRFYPCLVAIVVAGTGFTGMYFFTSSGLGAGGSFPEAGSYYDNIKANNPASMVASHVDGDNTYRYSESRHYLGHPISPLNWDNVYSLDWYSSNYNQYVDDFRRELVVSYGGRNYIYAGSDSRLALDAFSGARWFVSKGEEWRVPYGYAKTGDTVGDYQLWETDNALPLGFLYSSALPRDYYERLSPAQKQEALLQQCVVENESAADIPVETASVFSSDSVGYVLEPGEGVEVAGNEIRVTSANAKMKVKFDPVPESETYVYFDNLSYADYSDDDQADAGGSGLKRILSNYIHKRNHAGKFLITYTSGDRERNVNPTTVYDQSGYCGLTDWLTNMGYSSEGIGEIEMTFDRKGTYSFDSLEILAQPVEPIVDELQAMKNNALQNIRIDNAESSVEADAVLESDDARLAFFSLAYSDDWAATVDGQPADVVRTNTGFMGVYVQGAGSHHVKLFYRNSSVRYGAACSMVGIVAIVVLSVARKRCASRV